MPSEIRLDRRSILKPSVTYAFGVGSKMKRRRTVLLEVVFRFFPEKFFFFKYFNYLCRCILPNKAVKHIAMCRAPGRSTTYKRRYRALFLRIRTTTIEQ